MTLRLVAGPGLGLILALGGSLPLPAAEVALAAPEPIVETGLFDRRLPGFWLRSRVAADRVAADADAPARAAPDPAAGLVAEGQRLALHHCGRCHVVNETNRYGGIGSTPSFAALRALPQADDKFAAFWTFNPHPAFMQVEGQTTPFDAAHPPSAAPVILTQHEAEAIAAYAATIPPLDLGAPVKPR